MPTYVFKNKETQVVTTRMMKIAEREEFLKANPLEEQQVSAPAIGYNDLGVTKPSDAFREKLRAIKKDYKGSQVETF